MKNKIFLFKFIIFALIFSIFFLAEYSSYLFLKNHYQKISKDLNLINIKNFSLLSRKDIYEEDIELSAFYNFRYKKNYFVKGRDEKDLIKSQYKGLFFFPPIKDNTNPFNSKEFYNIYFFGGSTSFNEKGVPLSYHLYNELKGLKCNVYEQKKIRTIHAGNSGYATINQVNRLITDIIILKPDLVVFFDGVNDFIHSHSILNWDFNDTIHQESLRLLLRKKESFINFEELANLPNRFYSLYLLGRFSKKVFNKNIFPTAGEQNIYKIVKYRQEVIKKNTEKYNDGYNSLGAANYLNNHLVLSALSNSLNFKSMHILQPTLANDVKNKSYDKEILISLFPDPEGILTKNEKKIISDYWFNNKILFYKDIQKVFTTYNDKNNYYYDYSNIFLNEKLDNMYYDNIHYTDDGVDIIIKKISNDFKSFCNK